MHSHRNQGWGGFLAPKGWADYLLVVLDIDLKLGLGTADQ
jgi:hypothetical protein